MKNIRAVNVDEAIEELALYGVLPVATNLTRLSKVVNKLNHKWWHDASGKPLKRNKAELICLMHSELSECMEGVRKDLPDDKLPHRKMEEVELADCIIRILDYCGGFGLDIHGAIEEKLAYNMKRKDHTHEARAKAGGKKF